MAVSNHPSMYDANGCLLKHGLCLVKGADLKIMGQNMWEVLHKCPNIGMMIASDGSIHVAQDIADMIYKYIEMGGYSGMPLEDFLNKMFAGS